MIDELLNIILDIMLIVMVIIIGLCVLFMIGNIIMEIIDSRKEKKKDGTVCRHSRK